jgi:erythromycin esterase-like protein
MKHFALLLWIAAVALTRAPAAQSNVAMNDTQVVPSEVTSWLRDHAFAITKEPKRVAALGDRIGKARVVCLGDEAGGEAREPSALERNLLEYAVLALDLRVLAIDANATECAALDEYLVTGRGELSAIVASLREPRWRSREFLDAIAWLRVWNSKPNHANKVRLIGLDVQYTQLAAQQLGDYIQKVDYEAAPRITSILSPLRQVDQNGRPRYSSASPELRYVTMSYLPELQAMIEDNREAHVQASSEAEWMRAKQAALFLIQAEQVLRAAIEGSDEPVHDRVLADNVAHALEQAGDAGRVMVWTDLARSQGGMGAQLHERFGADVVRIGLTFAHGTDVARRGQLAATEIASLQSLCGNAQPARAWIDLRELPKEGAVSEWFRELRGKLDALVFFETVSAAAR